MPTALPLKKPRRYTVGSGNSVPSYVPLPNYLAMVEEALTLRGQR